MTDFWEDLFFKYGPLSLGLGLGSNVHYSRTEDTHILRINVDPEVKKEEIKVRLRKPGLLEIEWPRIKGEEIPVE